MAEEAHRDHEFAFKVNGAEIRFDVPIVTGRDALTQSGNTPASEYQLILVRRGRTRLVGTDDEVDLREGGELRAFASDRDYAFSVDEIGQVWGTSDMEVDEFFRIWPPRPGQHWVLERADVPDTVLTAGSLLSFGPAGVEHVVSRKDEHPDTVLVTVVTTAGVYPAEGAARYPRATPISHVLAEAQRKLDITDTTGWVVVVANNDVPATLSFAQAGLTGLVALEWGPREGGGGA